MNWFCAVLFCVGVSIGHVRANATVYLYQELLDKTNQLVQKYTPALELLNKGAVPIENLIALEKIAFFYQGKWRVDLDTKPLLNKSQEPRANFFKWTTKDVKDVINEYYENVKADTIVANQSRAVNAEPIKGTGPKDKTTGDKTLKTSSVGGKVNSDASKGKTDAPTTNPTMGNAKDKTNSNAKAKTNTGPVSTDKAATEPKGNVDATKGKAADPSKVDSLKAKTIPEPDKDNVDRVKQLKLCEGVAKWAKKVDLNLVAPLKNVDSELNKLATNLNRLPGILRAESIDEGRKVKKDGKTDKIVFQPKLVEVIGVDKLKANGVADAVIQGKKQPNDAANDEKKKILDAFYDALINAVEKAKFTYTSSQLNLSAIGVLSQKLSILIAVKNGGECAVPEAELRGLLNTVTAATSEIKVKKV